MIGQQKIKLLNPSFEDTPHCCSPPWMWEDCSHVTYSGPDVQPGQFEVVLKPRHGSSYLGMAVRQSDTWERVSQKLSTPLRAGHCYSFSIYLARSPRYRSIVLLRNGTHTEGPVNFTTPTVLQIWANNGLCAQKQLLAVSEPIVNPHWRKYDFTFKLKDNYQYIEFEAYYKTPVLVPYNGHILLDQASDIIEIPCPGTDLAKASKKKKHIGNIPKKQTRRPAKSSTVKKQAAQKQDKILKELDESKIRVGQVIKIEKLYFKADSSHFEYQSEKVLDELYRFLVNNPSVRVEIGGHTNGIPHHAYCDKLSEARAKAVADYLIEKGIAERRVPYRGYGKRKQVATNRTKLGRELNQRVEIRILSVSG